MQTQIYDYVIKVVGHVSTGAVARAGPAAHLFTLTAARQAQQQCRLPP